MTEGAEGPFVPSLSPTSLRDVQNAFDLHDLVKPPALSPAI